MAPRSLHSRALRIAPLPFLACACLWAAAQAPAPASDASTPVVIAPGVTYRHITSSTRTGDPLSIHILEIDRREKRVALRTIVARDSSGEMHRELPTLLAANAARGGTKVLAVVDADFDLAAPYLGIPEGLAVTYGQLWSTGKPDWPEIGVLPNGDPIIGLPSVDLQLSAGNQSWPIASLNKPLGYLSGGAPRLYTRAFRAAVKNEKPFRAVVIGKLSRALPLPADGTVRGEILRTLDTTNEVAIPSDGLLLVFPPANPSPASTATPTNTSALPKAGTHIALRIRTSVAGRGPLADASGGSHIIVRGGHRTIEGPHSDNLLLRHPRTAACTNAREWIFVAVDGRQPLLSLGMTLEELGDFMVSLGCTEAINLDGGGSTVMAIAFRDLSQAADNRPTAPLRIVNSPSDGPERGRGNAWLVIGKP